ncbi:uncharacterized protein [Atheta coriaria]|uniref:uncharacterized protein n=1 Tax=Dalotia coriaria TaxID=877792 RepID=UPI0031F43249
MTTLGKYCDGGHTCSPPKDCCKQGCCYPADSVFRAGGYTVGTANAGGGGSSIHLPANNMVSLVIGHWYFWAATTATLLGILCACSLWRRQSTASFTGASLCCGDVGGSGRVGDEHHSEPDSNGSCYAPPQYSRCGSFHQAPPPYSEVTSKPDLYPLVISYNGDAVVKSNGTSTGYLMVQYFRNFIVRPVGTLSATSTIDSLSSSFICNAANEANNIIPPPYSCTGSLEEVSVVVGGPPPQQQQPQSNTHQARNSTSSPVPAPTPPPPPIGAILGVSPSASLQQFLNSPRQEVVDLTDFVNRASSTDDPPASNLSTNKEEPPESVEPAVKLKKREVRLRDKFKPRHQASVESESDPEHNFSDLLNLSVCAPSSLVASSVVINAQSNPQMDMIYNSVTNSMTSSDISSLANLGTPDSPPRATSPTLEMRELLDKIQQLPAQHKSPVSAEAPAPKLKHYFNRSKAKTLYMPLTSSSAVGGAGKEEKRRSWFPRSAPTTPCGCFTPNFPTAHHEGNGGVTSKRSGSQKGSRSKLYDGSPLLREHDESDEENDRS